MVSKGSCSPSQSRNHPPQLPLPFSWTRFSPFPCLQLSSTFVVQETIWVGAFQQQDLPLGLFWLLTIRCSLNSQKWAVPPFFFNLLLFSREFKHHWLSYLGKGEEKNSFRRRNLSDSTSASFSQRLTVNLRPGRVLRCCQGNSPVSGRLQPQKRS